MKSQEEEILRARFDVACALAALGKLGTYEHSLPEKLSLTKSLSKLLEDCIEGNVIQRSKAQIKRFLSDESLTTYVAQIGTDNLNLCQGGLILLGGSGVNIQLVDAKVNRKFAFKVPRMSIIAYDEYGSRLSEDELIGRMNEEYKAFEWERHISRHLNHHNIAQQFFGATKGFTEFPGRYPFSISEWIDGAKGLDSYIVEENPSIREILDLFTQTYAGLSHVHQRSVVHWDIKADNVLVSSSGVVKIIDFGNAKLLSTDKDNLIVRTTQGKYPNISLFVAEDEGFEDSRRFRLKLPNASWNDPYIDLWMLAREWNRCLGFSQIAAPGLCVSEQQIEPMLKEVRSRLNVDDGSRASEIRDCLKIVLDRLLFPLEHEGQKKAVSEGGELIKAALYYSESVDVLEEINRVNPLFGAGQNFPELMVSLDDVVRLPVTGNSVFTSRIERMVNTNIVKATKLHFQLAQVNQVFPGATHTRFEHLLGTVTTAAYFLRSIYLNEMNGFWRVSANQADLRAVLLGAILHDAGHLAFGHFIEEMSDLVDGVRHPDFVRELLRLARMNLKGEAATKTLFSISKTEVGEFVEVLRNHWCNEEGRAGSLEEVLLLLDRLEAILGEKALPDDAVDYLTRDGTRRALNGIMRSIVDGPMDADKLDYLRRDSLHTGVFCSAGIDIERFFESLRICVDTRGDFKVSPVVGVSEKGIGPLETIITARYHLFSSVYWHRTVRCITAMLQRVISEICLECANVEEWEHFISNLLKRFRLSDDKESLAWLRGYLSKRGMLDKRLGDQALAEMNLRDLMDALQGERAKYFSLAFELSYAGPVGKYDAHGVSGREGLHAALCGEAYAEARREKADAGNVEYKSHRLVLQDLRRKLQAAFEAEVSKVTNTTIVLDTILVDIPEPNKDQLKGLLVDRRSKRTRTGLRLVDAQDTDALPDFVDITNVSPIAAALTDVFSKWARKVRIFFTPKDMERLNRLGLEPGDISNIWMKALYSTYDIRPEQYGLPLMR